MPARARAAEARPFSVAKRCGELGDVVLIGEKNRELARQARILFQEGVAIRRLAGLMCLEIVRDDLIEPLVSIFGVLAAPVG